MSSSIVSPPCPPCPALTLPAWDWRAWQKVSCFHEGAVKAKIWAGFQMHLDEFIQEKATHGELLKSLQLGDPRSSPCWGHSSRCLPCPCAPTLKGPQQAAKGDAWSLVSWDPIKSLLIASVNFWYVKPRRESWERRNSFLGRNHLF